MLLWILGLVSALGVAGAIALAIFAPALAAALLNGALALLTRLWATRAGMALIVGALALVAGEIHGRLTENAACEERIAQMKRQGEIDRAARDKEIAEELERRYGPQVVELRRLSDDLQKQVSDYEKRLLAGASAGSCQLGTDALRLRRKR